jgi:hypothetical protein
MPSETCPRTGSISVVVVVVACMNRYVTDSMTAVQRIEICPIGRVSDCLLRRASGSPNRLCYIVPRGN